jgi:hypothetical protein
METGAGSTFPVIDNIAFHVDEIRLFPSCRCKKAIAVKGFIRIILEHPCVSYNGLIGKH